MSRVYIGSTVHVVNRVAHDLPCSVVIVVDEITAVEIRGIGSALAAAGRIHLNIADAIAECRIHLPDECGQTSALAQGIEL